MKVIRHILPSAWATPLFYGCEQPIDLSKAEDKLIDKIRSRYGDAVDMTASWCGRFNGLLTEVACFSWLVGNRKRSVPELINVPKGEPT